MTKGHNQDKERKNTPQAESSQKASGENRHLKNQAKDNSPQGRKKDNDPSNGTKGQNAI